MSSLDLFSLRRLSQRHLSPLGCQVAKSSVALRITRWAVAMTGYFLAAKDIEFLHHFGSRMPNNASHVVKLQGLDAT